MQICFDFSDDHLSFIGFMAGINTKTKTYTNQSLTKWCKVYIRCEEEVYSKQMHIGAQSSMRSLGAP
jgi:hypothetical protein